MLKYAIALVLVGISGLSVGSVQETGCPADAQRRQAAVRFSRMVNTAEARFQAQNKRYGQISDLRRRKTIKLSRRDWPLTRSYHIVPLTVKPLWVQIDVPHLGLGDRSARRILASIETAGDRQAGRRRRPGNELHDGLIVAKGFAAPVRGDEGKEPVFDLVPFTGARREVTHCNGHAGVVRQALEFEFPEPQTPPVAAARIRGDEHG